MKQIKFFIIFMIVLLTGISISCNKNKENDNSETTFYFENTNTSSVYIPIIKININGIESNFIIDTGANMSLIDEKFYQEHQNTFQFLNEIDMTLNGVSGGKDYKAHYILGEIGDNIKIKHHFLTSDLTSVVNNIKSSMGITVVGILGADYLDRYGFTVDYMNRAIYRHNIPLDTLLNINKTFYN